MFNIEKPAEESLSRTNILFVWLSSNNLSVQIEENSTTMIMGMCMVDLNIKKVLERETEKD
jgi:hypothetical protein